MKRALKICCLIFLITTTVLLPAQELPRQPLYRVDLSRLVAHELNINPAGTLAFLTQDTLAVSICRNARCYLESLQLGHGEPRAIGGIRTDGFHGVMDLFRAPDSRVVVGNGISGVERDAVVLDSELHEISQVPNATGIRQSCISTTGETFVHQTKNQWAAYKMDHPQHRILEGAGLVLSVSDDSIAYLDSGAVHIEGLDGSPLGSFATAVPKPLVFGSVTTTPKVIPTLRFLGRDRLWSESGSDVRILDFNGKAIQTLDKPDGWGFRIGQSSDGSRILYDRHTRHIPLAEKIRQEEIAKMGVGADEEPNGEMVLVIDTKSGNKCFEWSSQTNLLAVAQYHADIDPSGRLVAIMTPTTLSIYELPKVCGTN
jgi:hypothetical protein